MGEIADMVGAWFNRRLPPAMEALGIRAAAEVSNSIDTPYPPASSPGKPPHKRTGNLQAGVSHSESGDGTETTIASARAEGDSRVPRYLEFGTSKKDGTSKMAARPYMTPVMNNGAALVIEAMRVGFDSGATAHAAGS